MQASNGSSTLPRSTKVLTKSVRLYLEAVMVVLLVLGTFGSFLVIDWFKSHPVRLPSGTMHTTAGFEMLGALAQDGGQTIEEQVDWEI